MNTRAKLKDLASRVEHCASELKTLPTATDTFRARQTLELASLQLRQASARAPESAPPRRRRRIEEGV